MSSKVILSLVLSLSMIWMVGGQPETLCRLLCPQGAPMTIPLCDDGCTSGMASRFPLKFGKRFGLRVRPPVLPQNYLRFPSHMKCN